MARFLITAQIRLAPPRNVNQVVSNIRRQLQNIQANVRINVPRNQTQQLNNLTRNITVVRRSTQQAADSMTSFGEQSALAFKRFFAFSVATTGFLRFVGAVREGVKEAIDFDREVVRIAQATGQSVSSLNSLRNTISSLSTDLGVSAAGLVNISRILTQAGLTAKDTEIALSALAKTELAPTFDNIADTTEGVIAIMSQFKTSVSDLEEQLSSINTVSAKFAVESEDIITAVRRTGGAFQAAGGSLNELVALFTSVRSTTRESAESIATGFRTIFTRLQRVSTQNFLSDLGIQLRNLEGQFVGPFRAIEELSRKLNNIPSTDPRFAQIIEELGGFRQVSKVIPLIKEFGTAQKALAVAQSGTTSLSEDAVKAQEALAVQIAKVREEFGALVREFANSNAFKSTIDGILKLASAFIKVSEGLKPILPLLGAVATVRIGSAAGSFLRGFTSRGRLGFATGGLVPGSGNGDTVHANLTPGEFVIRKQAVKSIGVDNLHRMNRYAVGGKVKPGKRGARIFDFDDTLSDDGKPLRGAKAAAAASKAGYDVYILTARSLSGGRKEQIQSFARAQGINVKNIIGTADLPNIKNVASAEQTSTKKAQVLSSIRQEGTYDNIAFFDDDKLNVLKAREAGIRAIQTRAKKQLPTIEKITQPIVQKEVDINEYFQKAGEAQAQTFKKKIPREALLFAKKSLDIGAAFKEKDFRALPPEHQKQLLTKFYQQQGAQIQEQQAVKETAFNDALPFGLVSLFPVGLSQGEEGPFNIGNFPVKILRRSLGKDFADNTEHAIQSQVTNLVYDIGSNLARQTGASSINSQALPNILNKINLPNIVGNIFEGSLLAAGAPFDVNTPSNAPLDFPKGIGPALGSLYNLPPNIPADATRTSGSAGKSNTDFVDQIKRYLTDKNQVSEDDIVRKQKFAKGGIVQKLQAGGKIREQIQQAIDNIVGRDEKIIENQVGGADFDLSSLSKSKSGDLSKQVSGIVTRFATRNDRGGLGELNLPFLLGQYFENYILRLNQLPPNKTGLNFDLTNAQDRPLFKSKSFIDAPGIQKYTDIKLSDNINNVESLFKKAINQKLFYLKQDDYKTLSQTNKTVDLTLDKKEVSKNTLGLLAEKGTHKLLSNYTIDAGNQEALKRVHYAKLFTNITDKDLTTKKEDELANRIRLKSNIDVDVLKDGRKFKYLSVFQQSEKDIEKQIDSILSSYKTLSDEEILGKEAVSARLKRKAKEKVVSKQKTLPFAVGGLARKQSASYSQYKIGDIRRRRRRTQNEEEELTPQAKFYAAYRNKRFGRRFAGVDVDIQALLKELADSGRIKITDKNLIGKYASGGQVDTVPAMLTPGEFVVNKKSAERIGYGNLRRLNKMAAGGIVGPQRFQTGGAATGISQRLQDPASLFFLLNTLTQFTAQLTDSSQELSAFTDVINTVSTSFFALSALIGRDTASSFVERIARVPQQPAYAPVTVDDDFVRQVYTGQRQQALLGNQQRQAALQARLNRNLGGLGNRPDPASRQRLANLLTSRGVQLTPTLNPQQQAFRSSRRGTLFGLNTGGRLAAGAGVLGGLGAGIVGNILANRERQKLATGDISGANEQITRIGDALVNAATGAATGAIFGPIGAAIGGIIGAATGYFTSTIAKEIEKARVAKSLEDFTGLLQRVSDEKITTPQASTQARAITSTLNTQLLTSTGDSLQDLRGGLKNNVIGMSDLLNKVSDTTQSFEELQSVLGISFLRLFAQASNLPFSQLKKDITEQIKKNQEAKKSLESLKKAQDLYAQSLRNIIDINKTLITFAARMETVDSAIENFIASFEGGQVKITDVSQIIKNPSDLLNTDIFVNALKTSVIPFLGEFGRSLSETAIVAQNVSRDIPNVLLSLRNITDIEGDTVINQFLDSFKNIGSDAGRFIRTSLESQLRNLVGEGGPEKFIESLNTDLFGTADKLRDAFQPIFDALSEVSKKSNEELTRFASLFNKRTELEGRLLDATQNIYDNTQKNLRLLSDVSRRPVNTTALRLTDAASVRTLSGGLNVNELQQRFVEAQKAISIWSNELNNSTSLDTNARIKLISDIEKEQAVINRVKRSLELLADATGRSTAAQEDLARVRQGVDFRRDLLKRALVGSRSADEVKAINTLTQSLLAVAKTGDFSRVPFGADLGEVVSSLEQIGDARLNVFGGRSGNEILQVLKYNFAKSQGLDEKDARILAGASASSAEAALLKEIRDAVNTSQNAQNALVRISGQELSGLNSLIDARVSTTNLLLQELIAATKEGFLTRQQEALKGPIEKRTEQQANIQQISQLSGIGLGNIEGLQALKNALPDFQLRKQSLEQQALATKFAGLVTPAERITTLGSLDVVPSQQEVIPASEIAQFLSSQATTDVTKFSSILDKLQSKLISTGFDEGTAIDFVNKFGQQLQGLGQGGFSASELVNTGKKVAEQIGKELELSSSEGLRSTAYIVEEFGSSASKIINNLDKLIPVLEKTTDFDFNKLQQTNDAALVELQKITALLAEAQRQRITTEQKRTAQQSAILYGNLLGQQLGGFIRMREGGKVPGYGNTDKVKALLTPGEYVIDKDTTEKLQTGGKITGTALERRLERLRRRKLELGINPNDDFYRQGQIVGNEKERAQQRREKRLKEFGPNPNKPKTNLNTFVRTPTRVDDSFQQFEAIKAENDAKAKRLAELRGDDTSRNELIASLSKNINKFATERDLAKGSEAIGLNLDDIIKQANPTIEGAENSQLKALDTLSRINQRDLAKTKEQFELIDLLSPRNQLKYDAAIEQGKRIEAARKAALEAKIEQRNAEAQKYQKSGIGLNAAQLLKLPANVFITAAGLPVRGIAAGTGILDKNLAGGRGGKLIDNVSEFRPFKTIKETAGLISDLRKALLPEEKKTGSFDEFKGALLDVGQALVTAVLASIGAKATIGAGTKALDVGASGLNIAKGSGRALLRTGKSGLNKIRNIRIPKRTPASTPTPTSTSVVRAQPVKSLTQEIQDKLAIEASRKKSIEQLIDETKNIYDEAPLEQASKTSAVFDSAEIANDFDNAIKNVKALQSYGKTSLDDALKTTTPSQLKKAGITGVDQRQLLTNDNFDNIINDAIQTKKKIVQSATTAAKKATKKPEVLTPSQVESYKRIVKQRRGAIDARDLPIKAQTPSQIRTEVSDTVRTKNILNQIAEKKLSKIRKNIKVTDTLDTIEPSHSNIRAKINRLIKVADKIHDNDFKRKIYEIDSTLITASNINNIDNLLDDLLAQNQSIIKPSEATIRKPISGSKISQFGNTPPRIPFGNTASGEALTPSQILDFLKKFGSDVLTPNRLINRLKFSKKKLTPSELLKLINNAGNTSKRKKFATGDFVPGTGSGDKVPAMLEPGEFVVNRNAARAHGPMLERLNNNTPRFGQAKKYQRGGKIGMQNGGAVNNISALSISPDSINKLNLVFQTFGSIVDNFTNQLASLNNMEISLVANHRVEIILNGADILKDLMPSIQNMIVSETNKILDKRLPTVGNRGITPQRRI